MLGTVLIVEDDHDTRVALRESLEEKGFYVVTAANGVDGFRLLRALSGPLVVLLDQNLPLMSGDEFLRQRLNYPDLINIPVIVMSAVSDRSLELGANAFLSKPLSIDVLAKMVKRFMDGDPSDPSAPAKGKATKMAAAAGKKKSILEFLGLEPSLEPA